ncbi:MAG: FtsH protease activity modulator HflK [Cardiobacteriaceae bacterium]|nr:FtsH protease activity modulator HflK [Cardiobacteriaceae bacterium]
MFNFLLGCYQTVKSHAPHKVAPEAPIAMSTQDPWGNNPNQQPQRPNPHQPPSSQNPNDAPPDLDEMLDKLFKNLGISRQGGNGNQERPSSQHSLPPFGGKALLGLSALALGIWLATGVYTVKEREHGVETVLGKYHSTTKSGLNWNWPTPIGQVEKLDVQSISTMRVGELKTQKSNASTKEQRTGQMLTSDENIVEIGATVQYRIADAKRFLFAANRPEDVLADIVVSAIREVVGANTVDDVLRDRRNEWPEQAKSIMVDILKQYDLGIEIVAFELQDARAPAEVQEAFEDAVRAREDEERARLQAEAFANQRLPAARGEAEQLRQSAQAYRAQVLAKANADVSRFNNLLAAYQLDKQVMRERLYLDTMTSVYQNSHKILIDADNATPILNLGGQQSALTTEREVVHVPVVSAVQQQQRSPSAPAQADVKAPIERDSRSRSR